MAYHVSTHLHMPMAPWLNQLVGFFPGVPIFFVISGFLISASWERSPDLKHYALRRALRIFPAMWVCLLVSIMLMAVLASIKPPVLWIVGQLTIGQPWTPGVFRTYGVGTPNGSLWTIPVELEFYAVLPAIYLIGRKLRSIDALLVVLSLASIGLQLHPLNKLVGFTVAPFLWEFVLGVLIQRHFDRLRPLLEEKALYWLTGFVAVAWMLVSSISADFVPLIATPILAFTTISFAYSWKGLTKKMLGNVDCSYGIYLYHMVWINATLQTGFVGIRAMFGICAMTSVAGWLSWVVLERRAIDLGRA